MSINDRISQLIHALQDTENSFAKRIGVSASVIFNTVNPKGRRSYPSGPVLEKLLSLEKDGQRLSAEWLMRGEGEMFGASQAVGSDDLKNMNITIDQLNEVVNQLREDFNRLKKDKAYDE